MRKRNFRPLVRRRGFTLLELLLVMAILVVLASMSGFAILKMRTGALKKATVTEIRMLENACVAYKLDVGVFPNNLADLSTQPSGVTNVMWQGPYLEKPVQNDPWQNKYVYSKNDAQEQVTIRSNGADGQAGTQDDIPQVVQ